MASPTQLPNPFTPMAFLLPDLAYQAKISMYILVGSLAVLIYDLLDNMLDDYILLTNYRITLPTVVYVLSRLGTVAYVLTATIFETTPIGNCATFVKGFGWLYPIAVPMTSLLFFFRVRAVFDRNIFIVAFFGFMWLAVVGGSLTMSQGITGTSIGTTSYCISLKMKEYVAAAAIIPLVNEALVFFALSWRLKKEYEVVQGGITVKKMGFGNHLRAFARGSLKDGQPEYLAVVLTSLLTVIINHVPAIPTTYRSIFTVPNVMIMNIMACRVFRNTKFGIFRGEETENTKPLNRASVIPLFLTGHTRGKGPVLGRISVDERIEVTKTIERIQDRDYPSHHELEMVKFPPSEMGTS